MNRYRSYWPLDDAPLKDGDGGFTGVDERLDPELLAPGLVASATNCRFRNGRVEPRRGITILPWMKADGRTPFTTTNAMHLFKVAPPAAYVDLIGTAAPFAPNGTNDAVLGVRLAERLLVSHVEVRLDGSASNVWSTSSSLKPPVGFLVAGALVTTAYTANLNQTVQDFQLVINLGSYSLGGAMSGHYLEVRVLVSTGTPSPIVGYLTYP